MGPGKSLVTSVTYNTTEIYILLKILKRFKKNNMVHMVMEAERLGLRSVGKGDGGEELDVEERELKLYLANTMEEDGRRFGRSL